MARCSAGVFPRHERHKADWGRKNVKSLRSRRRKPNRAAHGNPAGVAGASGDSNLDIEADACLACRPGERSVVGVCTRPRCVGAYAANGRMMLSSRLRVTFAAIYTDVMRIIASLHAAAPASPINGVSQAAALEAPSNCSADSAARICRIITPGMRRDDTGHRLPPRVRNGRRLPGTAQRVFAMHLISRTAPRWPK